MCSVMVGALLVSGVESVWNGEEIPAYANRPVRRDWRGQGITLARFAEMARFNYGSTVIVLLPKDVAVLEAQLAPSPRCAWARRWRSVAESAPAQRREVARRPDRGVPRCRGAGA